MKMQVKDVMIAPVKTTTLDSNAGYIRELMERKEIHSIPIIDIGPDKKVNVMGIVTATDLRGLTDESVLAEDIMTKKVIFVSPESSVRAAAKTMLYHEVHHLVVMNNSTIVGMLSALDFVRMVAEEKVA